MIAAVLSRILLNIKNMTGYFIQNYFLKDLHPIPQANKKDTARVPFLLVGSIGLLRSLRQSAVPTGVFSSAFAL